MDNEASGADPDPVGGVVSGRLAASSRFRILQHVAPLAKLGVDVRVRPPRVSKYARVKNARDRHPWSRSIAGTSLTAAKLVARAPDLVRTWRTDITWLEREMLPGRLTLEPLLRRPLVFDVDDAIWLLSRGHERATRAIAERSACVFAGNDFIADWFSQRAPCVERVWTAIDTERFRPASVSDPEEFVVGWTGSASTIPLLRSLGPALAKFLAHAAKARLVIMADAVPELPDVPPEKVTFVPWSPTVEADIVRGFDVGLMPLFDSDWGRGKCAFKLIQYFACGIPAVVSPVGMNVQLLAMGDAALPATREDQWVDALLALYGDPPRARAMGATGRGIVESSFALDVVARQVAAVFRRLR